MNPNDPRKRKILCILSKTGYLGFKTSRFLYVGSKKNEYSQRKLKTSIFLHNVLDRGVVLDGIVRSCRHFGTQSIDDGEKI